MDDIAKQAHQGSVAAIIQMLNQQLADDRVRTRAVFAEGVLHLLCEAPVVEPLERSVLVNHIQKILEDIAPRNIRRVNINSRIVQEQQLLWLEEISRNPDHLLWSQEIVLSKPNLLQQWIKAFKSPKVEPKKKTQLPQVSFRKVKQNPRFQRRFVSGISVLVLLLLAGWFVYDRLIPTLNASTTPQEPTPPPTPVSPSPTTPSTTATPSDPFTEAVRLAIEADAEGKTANTAAQWLDIAARWEKASTLMSSVNPDHPRYDIAQDRVILYRQNSQLAQQQAKQRQSQ
ncbi:hypothetical protein MC7420_6943 [Coleofasciculus chthonoplastes PCC 7420]|uniref:Uncharacterized protein n=1 Tax=Coleofasciculus chthonoplastes PCC 7420 TaxID=118168 RepID=B4W1S3_9CYAN|nr:hypothetical protein [Coleofasciculus chthonoplastes]EDX71857.1 hypothetical protein MC7420_6943 [Coleofasciculus chthonoplastes PCC 7420]